MIDFALTALAIGAIAMTVGKGSIFRRFRAYCRSRLPWLGQLVSCPYCLSHWLAFIAVSVYPPFRQGIIETVVWAFALVGASSLTGLVISVYLYFLDVVLHEGG